jgi:alpha-mannosidase
MLKLSFPVNAEATIATYETPYGFIERPANGDEEPGQRWIDVTGTNNGSAYGFALINDAKYGYSVHDNDIRISVIRSAVYAHHDPRVLDMEAEHLWQDQGIHTFRMLLVPHRDSWKDAKITRLSEEFLSPSVVIYQGIHDGSMPKSGSFISAGNENVIITSIKQAEANDDLIIRCVETAGIAGFASINLSFIHRTWKGYLKPSEIKSFRVNCKTGDIREVNLLEE